jgi:hypothetical protein
MLVRLPSIYARYVVLGGVDDEVDFFVQKTLLRCYEVHMFAADMSPRKPHWECVGGSATMSSNWLQTLWCWVD